MWHSNYVTHKTNKNALLYNQKDVFSFKKADISLSVSRVLSCTVIYLGLSSPISSSDINGNLSDGQPYVTDAQSCSGWGLHGIPRYRGIGELLPRLSILTADGKLNAYQSEKLKRLRRFISVALSLKSPSPDVIRHPVLCCSDFPHGSFKPRDRIINLHPFYIIAHFSKKITCFSCFFLRKIVEYNQ